MSCNFNIEKPYDVLFNQLRKEVETFMNTANARILMQDGKIASICKHIKENLSTSLTELLATMKVNGELTDIFTDAVLADIVESIERKTIYYEGVTSERLLDSVSSTYYYVTTIPKTDEKGLPIRLKVGIANDNQSMNTLESTLAFAHRKNATVCVNAGVYDVDTNYPLGTVIKDGKIIYNAMPPADDKYQFIAIKRDGSISVYDKGTTAYKMINDGVTDALCIFGSLIYNGITVSQTDDRKEPRQSIGIKQDGTIVIVSCDGRRVDSKGMTYDDLARIHYNLGSYNAYILDGGGSTSTVVRGIKQNENVDHFITDRAVSSFLYVAKETDVAEHNNANNDIGAVKQYLLEKLYNNTDFLKGFMRLRGQENYFSPGIEFYVNNEDSRRAKFGMSFDKTNVRNTYMYLSLKAENTEKTNMFRLYDAGCLVQAYSGTSSERPSASVGCCFFDRTLNKPIWYNGTNWVDATGTVV